MRYEFPDADIACIMNKLGWGAEQAAFSVDLTPKECRFLLQYIAELELKVKPLDDEGDRAPTVP